MPRLVLFSQFGWPDSAPSALYADQLARRMEGAGWDVRYFCGTGFYRRSERPPPPSQPVRIPHFTGRRGNLVSVAREFYSVTRAFGRAIRRTVEPGDVVVMSSAPPFTVHLAPAIRRQGGVPVYWLHDYYPALLHSLGRTAGLLGECLDPPWSRALENWTTVVTTSSNLRYQGHNAVLIRNWATLDFPHIPDPVRGTALYTGNLGYAHSLPHFVSLCEKLRDEGRRITIRGDGPGIGRLPAWLKAGGPFASEQELRQALLDHELHLMAADPAVQDAQFPSKVWNSLACKRAIRWSGLEGRMAREWEYIRQAPDHGRGPAQWQELLGRHAG